MREPSPSAELLQATKVLLDLSYAELPESAARTFRLLAAQPCSSLSPEAVAALTGGTPEEVRADLDALDEWDLVQVTVDGRVHLHRTARAYAAGRAREEDDRTAARKRLIRWYVAAAATAGDAIAPDWAGPAMAVDTKGFHLPDFSGHGPLSWMDTEFASVVALVQDAERHGLPEAWQIPVLYLPFLYLTRHWSACLELFTRAVRLARRARSRTGLARALHGLGWILHELGRDDEALRPLREAATLHESGNDDRGRAWTMHALGESLTGTGHYTEALRRFDAALRHFAAPEWPFGTAIVSATMSTTFKRMGRVEEAIRVAEDALHLALRTRVSPLQSHTHHQLGLMRLEQGHAARAFVHFEQARLLRRDNGQPRGEAESQLGCGKSLAALGLRAEAEEAVTAAIAILSELQDAPAVAEAQLLRQQLGALEPESTVAGRP
ncbi:tetratricopeptide (TPR) repeat protein [Amycolatopsis bartoniae]|uniref:Tetratricopeptide repeat protein n=1 Tax=Amycolatopsis bartoniae TaxID=941986 RepID=A0A8H9IU67_9PSEU|nr:tetratricopeptide repeat protein [Amycolatopsis bartoniae]MBB2937214.1 tetratricopeptide (TPR) repeat protein [Amycolatopsis bartoniae]TVT09502.1 tetratricopeptide repeat protein [Amycolatopsis bartoniae]GHF53312.1 hypothetical protein GCM10017566_28380 [Amycolatopsis bartoniae]